MSKVKISKKQEKINAMRKHIIEVVNDWAIHNEVKPVMLGENPEEFADAIIGVTNDPHAAVVYRSDLVITALKDNNKLTWEEAQEWYDYNIVRSLLYLDKDTAPIIIEPLEFLP